MTHLATLLAVVASLFFHDTIALKLSCNCSHECFDQVFSDVRVDSFGYKANSGVSAEINGSSIHGGGAFSFYEARIVNVEGDAFNDGDSSANNVQQHVASGEVSCRGSHSCSQIKHLGLQQLSTSALNCNADQSCSDSIIYIGNLPSSSYPSITIYADGAYSLMNSEIHAVSADVTILLKGHYAGFNATLFCEHDSKCQIDCFGNGCSNFRYNKTSCSRIATENCVTIVYHALAEYINGDTCFENYCSGNGKWNGCDPINHDSPSSYPTITAPNNFSQVCPVNVEYEITQHYADSFLENPFYLAELDGLSHMMDDICTNQSKSNVTLCKTMLDAANYSVDINDWVFDNSNEVSGVGTIISNVTSQAICCRGYSSCSQNNLTATTQGLSNGNDESDRKYIICSGELSCWGGGVNLETSVLYCGGKQSCGADFYNIHYSNNSHKVTNVSETIYCLGEESCVHMKMIKTRLVYCGGENSCASSIFVNIEHIIVAALHGGESHNGIETTISSNNGTNTRLTMFGHQELPNEIFFECGPNDTCLIECKSPSACYSDVLQVNCVGFCYAVCGYILWFERVGCPHMNGNYNITNTSYLYPPTIPPTFLPTMKPTLFPTTTATPTLTPTPILSVNITFWFEISGNFQFYYNPNPKNFVVMANGDLNEKIAQVCSTIKVFM